MTAGRADWDEILPPTKIEIIIDANNVDHIGFVLHELLHIVMSRIVFGTLDDTLEEIAMVAWHEDMYRYIKKDPRRLLAWNDLINEKLSSTKVDVPLEVRVQR